MLIVAAILAIFVYGMIAAMLGTILPNLSERFKLTPEQNGTIAMAQAIGLIIASISVGPLIDNQGKKVGLVLGLALIAIALFRVAQSEGLRLHHRLSVPARDGRRHHRDRRQRVGQ